MTKNPFSLEGKRVLITGASSGIGKVIAVECASIGADVVITGRDESRLNSTFLSLPQGNHGQIVADFQKSDDISKLVEALPKLDGIVHCAGVVKTIPFSFMDVNDLNFVLNINFTVPVVLSSLSLKMKKLIKGASIVFISSISGVYCSFIGNSLYSGSKGAVNGIVKGMALDLASKDIRVNSITPGMIDTDFIRGGIISDEQIQIDKKKYPLKRYGRPEEVAYAAIYLLSDASKWITGSNLLIDGGYTLN